MSDTMFVSGLRALDWRVVSLRTCIVAFVLGTAWLQRQAVLPSPYWLAAAPLAAAGALAALSRGRRVVAAACLVGAAFAAGFSYAAEAARVRTGESLSPAWEGRDITVVGVVTSLTEGSARATRFDFEVEHVSPPDAVVPHRLGLGIFRDPSERTGGRASFPLPVVRAAERWQLVVRLKRPHGNANPYGFDLEGWLLARGVRATGAVRPGADNIRLNAFVARPGLAIERARESIRGRFEAALPGHPYVAVLTALVVGDQSGVTRHEWDVFWRTGVGHLISISGVHVTLIAALCAALARRGWAAAGDLPLRVPARRAGMVVGVIAALAYALLAGFSVPTQRTLWMFCAVAWASFAGAFASASRILCAALLAVVLADPWASIQFGFLLSFGAVAAILFAAANLVGRQAAMAAAWRTQWSVTLAMVPMQAQLFRQVSLISPLANAFAIPLVGHLVVPLAMLGACIPVALPLELAHWLFALCMRCLEALAAVPGAVWCPVAPGAAALAAGSVGAVWALLPGGFPARWLALPMLLPLCLPAADVPAPGAFRVTVLDVGQGLAVVVETRRHRLLYDTGPQLAPDADAGARIVVPHLLAGRGTRLDGVIVSHRDADHSGGALSVLDAMQADWLLSSLEDGHRILAHSRRPVRCAAGQHWQWDGVDFDVLYPSAASYGEARPSNARGCVVRVRSAAGTALLPADIESASEAELLAGGAALRADLLVAPHHGSTTSSTPAFVAAVGARVVVIANGYRNRFGHPKPAVVARYRATGAAVYRSDEDGAVTVEFDTGRPGAPTTYRGQHRRYWDAAAGR